MAGVALVRRLRPALLELPPEAASTSTAVEQRLWQLGVLGPQRRQLGLEPGGTVFLPSARSLTGVDCQVDEAACEALVGLPSPSRPAPAF